VSVGEIAARGHATANAGFAGTAQGYDPNRMRDLTVRVDLVQDRLVAGLEVRDRLKTTVVKGERLTGSLDVGKDRLVLRLVGDRLQSTLEET
jgi:hypothetical protein